MNLGGWLGFGCGSHQNLRGSASRNTCSWVRRQNHVFWHVEVWDRMQERRCGRQQRVKGGSRASQENSWLIPSMDGENWRLSDPEGLEVPDIFEDASVELPWSSGADTSSNLLEKIVRIAEICRDALKSGELNRRQVRQLSMTMLDTYESLLVKYATSDPILISTVFHRCASLTKSTRTGSAVLSRRWSFLSELLKLLQKQIDSLKPRTLATIVWSLGCFGPGVKDKALGGGLTVADFLHQVAMVCEVKACRFHPIQFSGVLVGLANLDHRNERWIAALCIEMKFKLFLFGAREMGNVAWAIGRLKFLEGCTVIEEMESWVEPRISKFNPQGLGNFLWGAARAGARLSTSFLEECAEYTLSKAYDMKPQDLTNILWAFVKLRFYPGEEFLLGIEPAAVRKIKLFKPQEVTGMLYGYAMYGESPPRFLEAASLYIREQRHRFSLQELVNCGWALAMLRALTREVCEIMITSCMEDNRVNSFRASGLGIRARQHITDVDLNQMYQCVLYLRYFCSGEDMRLPVGLEDACYEAWVDWNGNKPINYLIPKVMSVMESLDYECSMSNFLPSLGITLNMVQVEGQEISIEVVGHPYCFDNCPHKCQGPILWRHHLLKHAGVEPLVIYEDIWLKLDHQDQAGFLKDNLLVLRDLDQS